MEDPPPRRGRAEEEQWLTTPTARAWPYVPYARLPELSDARLAEYAGYWEHAREELPVRTQPAHPRRPSRAPHRLLRWWCSKYWSMALAEQIVERRSRTRQRAGDERATRSPPDTVAGPSASILVPRHWIDRVTTVRVDRGVHGTQARSGGTAAYKYGMDVLFTVHCKLCNSDVDARGAAGGSDNCQRRTHYRPEDPGVVAAGAGDRGAAPPDVSPRGSPQGSCRILVAGEGGSILSVGA